MILLKKISQYKKQYIIDSQRLIISTQWSAVFDLKGEKIYICLARDYQKVYRISFPNIPCL